MREEPSGFSSPALVFYRLDSAELLPEARTVLDGLADALRKRRDVQLTISGHTCELGTTEYNLALGQQRARVARDYLVRLGVDSERVSAVSYGEEAPFDTGAGEEHWSKNRRSEVVVTVSGAAH